MDKAEEGEQAPDTGWLSKALTVVWEEAIIGDNSYSPEKSCYQLAAEYRGSGRTAEQCARDFINWQTGKSGLSGFAFGLPGLAAMPITIPADFASTSYLQLRMIAVIGILFGWEPKSDQLRTVAVSCLLGTVAGEAVRDIGVKASGRLGSNLVKGISGSTLNKLNRFLHIPRLFVKGASSGGKAGAKAASTAAARAGSQGLINLSKMVPLLGGLVGGGLNMAFTRQMGLLAMSLLKDGPPNANVIVAV